MNSETRRIRSDKGSWNRAPLAAAIATLSLAAVPTAFAAEATEDMSVRIEEVVVVGRLLSASAMLDDERIEDDALSNLLGSEDIGRVGDSTVAAALRRVSGLTLVNDKFVYVRGLGERYSSTTLNGARVPSVDLSRNVIPLDIFPTTIVDSLKVQKTFTADRSAAFGGGAIDIRTKGLPDGLVFGAEIGSAWNTQNDGEAFTYSGGDDDFLGRDDGTRALPDDLRRQVLNFRGDIGVQNVLTTLRARGNPDATFADAQAVNRALATQLNRDISLKEEDVSPDMDLRAYVGNSVFLTDDLEAGFLVSGAYENEWRETTKRNANFRFPEERTDTEVESTYAVSLTGNANFGLRFADEHELTLTSLYLRNTDDETAVRTFFNENREVSSGTGFQGTRIKYEEREIEVNQLRGRHELGSVTRELFDDVVGDGASDIFAFIPEYLEFSWFYSDSSARTDIPNQIEIAAQGTTDRATGQAIDMGVIRSPNAADFRFTTLEEQVEDSGWALRTPVYFSTGTLELAGGFQYTRQARTYEQLQFGLGPVFVADIETLQEPLGVVFSDEVLTDPANDFVFGRAGTNNQSYIAATITDAWWGTVDYTYRDTWRVSAGLRWEDYRQAAVDFDPLAVTIDNPVVTTDPAVLAQSAFAKDDLYPSLALTYMGDWLAETFQLRFAYSETVTRPDLREITDASYIDPLTDTIVNGNPGTIPAEFTNYDARAEWFMSNGDNFSVTAFYKEIASPIEFFESPASDTNTAREIVNADSAEIYGVEVEFLKTLGFVHSWLDPFYVQGNLTVQESELVAGPQADAPTNAKRELSNAAPWILNLQLGYDSYDGLHSATLIYNVSDEQLFVAGRNGAPDGFQQPFHSLDATYFFYPTEKITVKGKFQNILDESLEIERQGVTVFGEDIGRTFSVSVRWDF
ncbi:MAG TPA: TonB-dependent receptor [Pseudomonadales bacterium]|nr:TonB-dependent receptor [Pseudomonadales bacterium]